MDYTSVFVVVAATIEHERRSDTFLHIVSTFHYCAPRVKKLFATNKC